MTPIVIVFVEHSVKKSSEAIGLQPYLIQQQLDVEHRLCNSAIVITKIYQVAGRMPVDIGHHRHLLRTFTHVVLVDTHRVDP